MLPGWKGEKNFIEMYFESFLKIFGSMEWMENFLEQLFDSDK